MSEERPTGSVSDPILDLLLEEELTAAHPPDLTARVLERLARGSPARPDSQGRQRGLVAAALTALAFALVVAIWLAADRGTQDARPPDPDEPVAWRADLLVPDDLADARRCISAHERLDARIFAVRDPASDRLVPVKAHPFEMLTFLWFGEEHDPTLRADPSQDGAWSGLVLDVLSGTPQPAAPFAAQAIELEFEIPERGTLVVGIDDTVDPVRVQVRGLPELWTVARGHPLPRRLRAALGPLLGPALEHRGVAIGRTGLDRLPDAATRIRAYSLRAEDVAALARFPALRSLDLSGSPEAATVDALSVVATLTSLRSLVLPADGIGLGQVEQLATMSTLAELFIAIQPLDLLVRSRPLPQNAFDDRCAVRIGTLRNLTELWLDAPALTDRGVAALGQLPLKTLGIRAPAIDGSGFASFSPSAGRQILLIGCERLSTAGLRAIGAAAATITLAECPLSADGLRALREAGAQDELGLLRCEVAPSWPAVLEVLRGTSAPRKLGLGVDRRFRAEDLAVLAGSASLERVEILAPRGLLSLDALRDALPGVAIQLDTMPR